MPPPTSLDDAILLLDEFEGVVKRQESDLSVKSQEIIKLRHELALLRRNMFSRKSEKIHPGQLTAFDDDGVDTPGEYEDIAIPAHTSRRKVKGHGKGQFPDHLPRTEHTLELDAADRACPCCAKTMVLFGVDVSERADIIPTKICIQRYLQSKYACPDGHGVIAAPMPEGVVDGGKYEASVYAHLVTPVVPWLLRHSSPG